MRVIWLDRSSVPWSSWIFSRYSRLWVCWVYVELVVDACIEADGVPVGVPGASVLALHAVTVDDEAPGGGGVAGQVAAGGLAQLGRRAGRPLAENGHLEQISVRRPSRAGSFPEIGDVAYRPIPDGAGVLPRTGGDGCPEEVLSRRMRNVDDQPEGRVCGKRGVGRGIESEHTDLRIGPQTQW